MATTARAVRIKDLKGKILKLATHPYGITTIKSVMEKKDHDIVNLKNKLNIFLNHPV